MDKNLCPFAEKAFGFRLSGCVLGMYRGSDRLWLPKLLRVIERPRAGRQDDEPSLLQNSDRLRGLVKQEPPEGYRLHIALST